MTSEHPSAVLARAGTKPEHVALLERHARVVVDLPIERVRDPSRVYEPFDLHYLPFTGLATLARPGPRMRVWRIPGADALPRRDALSDGRSSRRAAASRRRSAPR